MAAWHSLSIKDVFSKLRSGSAGLGGAEARSRLGEFGPNSIAIKKDISPLRIFVNQFKSILVILLILAAMVSLALSYINPEEAETIDALLIFAIVIANAAFGFLQEYKAEKSIEALTRMAAPRASVIRDGREAEIKSEEVVPGDVLILREGDKVAADARLLESFSFYCDESSLTGESVPDSKQVGTLPEKTPLADRNNMVFMNAVVTRGRATALVVKTGLHTEVGKIAREISEAPDKVTQFQIEIEDVGKKVSIMTLAILIVIAATEFLMGTGDIVFIFITAVALGVAAIPEGLPAVVTLSLSMATNRMVRQNALLRRLSTVQDLGSVNVICTDKTGTLTENVMTVTRIHLDGWSFDVTGKGFEKSGEFIPLSGGSVGDMDRLLKCAALCNDARESDGVFKGDPTEIAVLIPAYKAGLDVESLRKKLRRVGEVSFSAERKMMSTANSDGKRTYSFVKGAPEVLLRRCTGIISHGRVRKITGADRDEILGHNNQMAAGALRVLGFAYKESPKSYDELDLESGLVFLGLMGMKDPPREGVKEAVEDCRRAGIRVIMVTGDNRYTAEALGKELGFGAKTMTGEELDSLSEGQLAQAVERIDIYARTSPKHKVMLLKALKANNHIVCMTGDGVNDAAAIKNSDVGIAMGIRGTEVTKQASDIIILDDNFITIRNAISEGRATFDNIRKFVVYLLGANISEVLIVFLATVLSLGISPKIAIQLLWINLVTDGMPALALGIDPPANDIMRRKPRRKGERMIDAETIYFMVSIGISATIAILVVYAHLLSFGNAPLAQTVLFITFILMEMLIVYAVRWRYGKGVAGVASNKWLHIAVFLSILLAFAAITPPLNVFFGTVPLGAGELEEVGAGLLGFMLLLAIALKAEPHVLGRISGKGPGIRSIETGKPG
ncbi:cation-translocating P-type ATPase [Candidatus Micrarchaeota archaeon]|nr:cation-translocating P-type ATPase [Candidatus Micrarchaeota archaeon]